MNRTISRSFDMSGPKRSLGIAWSQINDDTYYGQLGNARPFIMCWIKYIGNYAPNAQNGTLVQITYNVTYK